MNAVVCEPLNFEYESAIEISDIVATSDLGSPIPFGLLTLNLRIDAIDDSDSVGNRWQDARLAVVLGPRGFPHPE